MNKPNRLKELREKAALNQTELANAIHYSQSIVSGWENGSRRMNLNQAKMLAGFFNVSVGYLAGDDMQIEKPTVEGDSELRNRIIDRVNVLPDPALERTWAFLEGLRAGQEIPPAGAAAPGSDAARPE